MVRAQLRRLTGGDHSWADDLAQETFIQAWRKLNQFRADARFSTWLYRIAYTTFLQANRSRRNDLMPVDNDRARQEDPFSELALHRDMTAALRSLPEAESAALMLCYDFDLSHQEAAYVLGIPVGTVKTHIARGKTRLRDLLAAWRVESTG
jgi:RNA polymerase sigma-70 factor (ECF subfamily)